VREPSTRACLTHTGWWVGAASFFAVALICTLAAASDGYTMGLIFMLYGPILFATILVHEVNHLARPASPQTFDLDLRAGSPPPAWANPNRCSPFYVWSFSHLRNPSPAIKSHLQAIGYARRRE